MDDLIKRWIKLIIIYTKLYNYKIKKKLQINLIFRYNRIKIEVFKKKFITIKIIFIIITYSDKIKNNKFRNIAEILTSLYFIK